MKYQSIHIVWKTCFITYPKILFSIYLSRALSEVFHKLVFFLYPHRQFNCLLLFLYTHRWLLLKMICRTNVGILQICYSTDLCSVIWLVSCTVAISLSIRSCPSSFSRSVIALILIVWIVSFWWMSIVILGRMITSSVLILECSLISWAHTATHY